MKKWHEIWRIVICSDILEIGAHGEGQKKQLLKLRYMDLKCRLLPKKKKKKVLSVIIQTMFFVLFCFEL